jgi:hypothetical protein
MAYSFKVWNQGNDGATMGIRVADVDELQRFAPACSQPDLGGAWASLGDYLNAAAAAQGTPPQPYSRIVDVVWLNTIGYGSTQLFPGRTLVVTYTGNERQTGGFASQCYCIVDPAGYPTLSGYHRDSIEVSYVAGIGRDVLVVLP